MTALVCWLKDFVICIKGIYTTVLFLSQYALFLDLSIDQNASVIGGEEGGDRKKPPVARAPKQPDVQEPTANGEEPERSDSEESEN